MVSVEDHHRWLAPLLYRIHQVSCEFVHLVDLIYIIFPFILKGFILNAFHRDLRILDHFLLRVIPVSLHADGEDKILLPGGIQSVHDVVDQDIVLGPAILRQLKDVHKLLAGKAVKSHVVEHPRPAVEVPAVVVKSVGSVTKGLQGCGRALTGRFLQDRFIGIFPRAEVPQVHPGKHLELCIGCSGSHRRNLEITGGILIVHLMKIGAGVLGSSEEFRFLHIKIRLQLHKQDVGQVLFRLVGLISGNLPVFADPGNGLFAVIVGLVDPRVKKTGHKTVGQTVILVGKGDISKIGRHHPVLHRRVGHKAVYRPPDADGHKRQEPVHFPGILAAPPPHEDHPDHHGHGAHDQHDQLKSVEIIVDQAQAFRRRLQVLGIERRHPLQQHIAVGHAKDQPEHADDDPGKHSPAEEIDHREGDKDHKRIVKEHHRRLRHITPGFKNRMPGNGLDGEIDHAGQKSME